MNLILVDGNNEESLLYTPTLITNQDINLEFRLQTMDIASDWILRFVDVDQDSGKLFYKPLSATSAVDKNLKSRKVRAGRSNV